MTARFKFRILSSFLEEVGESRIEITQGLLKNDRTDLGKEGFLRLLFPFGELQCGVVIAEGFLVLLPGLAAKFEGLIVYKASATEGSGQLLGLFIRGEELVFESLLNYHAYIFYIRCMRFLAMLIAGEAPAMPNSSPSKPAAVDGVFFGSFDKIKQAEADRKMADWKIRHSRFRPLSVCHFSVCHFSVCHFSVCRLRL